MISFLLFIISLFFIRFLSKFWSLRFAVFFIFIYLFFLATDFIFNEFVGLSVNIFTINSILISLSGAPFFTFINKILLIVLVILSIIFFSIIIYKRTKLQKNIKLGLIFWIVFLSAFITNPTTISLYKIYLFFNPPIEPMKKIVYPFIKIPEAEKAIKDKNIVYIYLEGLSRNFTLDDKFPNLMPNLRNLNNKIEFTNIRQTIGADITVDGLFASHCGLPHGFYRRKKTELNYDSVVCSTEILKKQGYYLYFMKGFDLNFQNTDKLLKARKYEEMIGRDKLIERGVKNMSEWGAYDDDMLDIAWKDFNRLSENGEKFVQTILTNSTHTPDGFLPKSCSNVQYDIDSKMLKAVKCTDILISKFINKIRSSKYSKNTIIAIQNDHLMPYHIVSDIDKFSDKLENPESKMLFIILDDDIKDSLYIDTNGSSLDTWTTLFGYMGILDEMHLGRNLLKEPTIVDSAPDTLLPFTIRILKDINYKDINRIKNSKSD